MNVRPARLARTQWKEGSPSVSKVSLNRCQVLALLGRLIFVAMIEPEVLREVQRDLLLLPSRPAVAPDQSVLVSRTVRRRLLKRFHQDTMIAEVVEAVT